MGLYDGSIPGVSVTLQGAPMPSRDTLTPSSPWVELSASANLGVMAGRALRGRRWCQWSGWVDRPPARHPQRPAAVDLRPHRRVQAQGPEEDHVSDTAE